MTTEKKKGVPVVFGEGKNRVTLLPLAFGGRAFYVRKCRTGELVGEAKDKYYALNGIALPDRAMERSLYVEVVGIGPNVGSEMSKSDAERLHRKRYINGVDEVKVGDFLLVPNEHPLVQDSYLGDNGFYVEESVPLAIVLLADKPEK
jgi:hypothetical protein